jgi:PPK2 family polyphosphate:nucleotide phosphotransferase
VIASHSIVPALLPACTLLLRIDLSNCFLIRGKFAIGNSPSYLHKNIISSGQMKIRIHPDDYRVKPGRQVDVTRIATKVDDIYQDKDDYEDMLKEYMDAIQELQEMLYAHDKYSVLVIFQGMDASGKDGAIKHVTSGINPSGVSVSYFKRPTDTELDHDFLWRTLLPLPERGRIGVYNRSYYEEVLVVRVHPEILHDYQRVPAPLIKDNAKVWKHRLQDIANFESYLTRQGVVILKFFLHVSKDEQKKRLLERIEEPDKNWKMNPQDVKERAFWKDYMNAYNDALESTSTEDAPWYVIPADGKRNARLIISQILLDRLRKLPISFPEVSDELKAKLEEIRETLLNEK